MASLADRELVTRTMDRYRYMLDNGHTAFVRMAAECDGFFTGRGQWTEAERASLRAKRKPVVTINQILPTMNYVLGNQINNRVATTFSPKRNGATDETAAVLGKVYKQISDNNELDWQRSEMFADGMVTGRGYLDVRLDFSDSLRGEVRVTQLDPRNVLLDPDANSYDPDGWKDVMTVQFLSPADIEVLWGKQKATRVALGVSDYDTSSLENDLSRATFGAVASKSALPSMTVDSSSQGSYRRAIAVIERQWRKLDSYDHFVWLTTGDIRPVPDTLGDEGIASFLAENPDVTVTKRLGWRIRWTVVANGVLLHDDWSPYQRFTVFPYFPYFRRGATIGAVESLMDPQRLLNKTTSQELHILNTTANSGWKVKRNNLSNMSVSELEQRGGETGLVVEVEDMDGLDKIQPNQVPTGLDRMAFKAEDYIKSISLVSDYMRGSAREDVAAKAVVANQQTGNIGMAKPLENLTHSDKLLARHILELIQTYYDDERVIRVMSDTRRQQSEDVTVNQVTQNGVLNDLTVGEYDITITSVPARELDEDSEFEQAVRMRTDLGVAIPDDFIIRTSRLREKQALLEQMAQSSEDSRAQQDQAARLALAKEQADLQKIQADAVLSQAKAHQAMTPPPAAQDNTQVELAKLKMEYELKARELMMNMEIKKQELELKKQETTMKAQLDASIRQQEADAKKQAARIQARKMAEGGPAAAPTSTPTQEQ